MSVAAIGTLSTPRTLSPTVCSLPELRRDEVEFASGDGSTAHANTPSNLLATLLRRIVLIENILFLQHEMVLSE